MNKVETFNLNEMFGIPKELDVQEKPIEEKSMKIELHLSDLIPFRNHPFKLYQGERLDDMVESIKEHGIITPLIIRPLENNQYEILSGHNRANAGRLAGLKKAPVVIREDLTDEEAMLIVTETNIIQRSFTELSHSEKARILTERHEAEKRWGKNSSKINEIEMMSNIDGYEENNGLSQVETKLRSDERVGQKYDMSRASVARYIRIDKLIDELKIRLDNDNEIPFMAGVDLSYLNEEKQKKTEELLDEYNYEIDLRKSGELKKLNKNRNLTFEKMNDILSGEYFKKKTTTNKTPKLSSKFNKNVISKYITEDRGIKDIEELIEKLLEEHFLEEI